MSKRIALILILFTAAIAGVRIAAIKIDGANNHSRAVAMIDTLLFNDPAIDIVVCPAENFGGHMNKARITFYETGHGLEFAVADTFARSTSVFEALENIAFLARTYSATIIPGTLWEVDDNFRCFETALIFGPDGNVSRVRRKAHQTKSNDFIDPTVRLDTIFTKEGDLYTYLITISNEAGDISAVYGRADVSADIWLMMDRRWPDGIMDAIALFGEDHYPDWDMIYSCTDTPSFKALIDSNWIGPTALLVACDLEGRAGAAIAGNITRGILAPDEWFVLPDYWETPSALVVHADPLNPIENLRVDIIARDTSGAPVESLFVNYGTIGAPPSLAGWTNESGMFKASYMREDSLFFLFAFEGMIPSPEETTIFVSYEHSRCTVYVALTPDTLHGISEIKRPVTFDLTASPNPFNSAVSITAPTGAEIEIFDVNGRCLAELPRLASLGTPSQAKENSPLFKEGWPEVGVYLSGDACIAPTTREYIWSPPADLASGVYLLRVMEGGGNSSTIKLVFLK